MIPSADFYIKLSIEISEEVIRLGFATIGFAIAIWGMVKIIEFIAKPKQQGDSE